MKGKIALITLGVDDFSRSLAFYLALGFFADPDGHLWEAAYNPFTDLT